MQKWLVRGQNTQPQSRSKKKVTSNLRRYGFKSQFKRADKSGAQYALVIGDEEAEQGNVVLKPLRDDSGQKVYAQQETAGYLCDLLGLESTA